MTCAECVALMMMLYIRYAMLMGRESGLTFQTQLASYEKQTDENMLIVRSRMPVADRVLHSPNGSERLKEFDGERMLVRLQGHIQYLWNQLNRC
jgi:hypothetical protein